MLSFLTCTNCLTAVHSAAGTCPDIWQPLRILQHFSSSRSQHSSSTDSSSLLLCSKVLLLTTSISTEPVCITLHDAQHDCSHHKAASSGRKPPLVIDIAAVATAVTDHQFCFMAKCCMTCLIAVVTGPCVSSIVPVCSTAQSQQAAPPCSRRHVKTSLAAAVTLEVGCSVWICLAAGCNNARL